MTSSIYSYNEFLTPATEYYKHRLGNNHSESTNAALSEYFLRANSDCANPCVARMALQQARVDAEMYLNIALRADEIDKDTFNSKRQQLLLSEFELNRDARLLDLEHKMIDQYPKTFCKRLAISRAMTDNALAGLQPSKIAKSLKIINYKMLKKLYR